MPDAALLWLFFCFVFGIIIVPGMDMAFVLANALTSGRRLGLYATAGVVAGGVVHVVVGALGVGAVLKLFPSSSNCCCSPARSTLPGSGFACCAAALRSAPSLLRGHAFRPWRSGRAC